MQNELKEMAFVALYFLFRVYYVFKEAFSGAVSQPVSRIEHCDHRGSDRGKGSYFWITHVWGSVLHNTGRISMCCTSRWYIQW